MTDKFISIEGIAKRYPGADGGATAVFENLWLSMARGEFGCVIGHSGCGKTTVLNILAGLDAPSDGRIGVRDLKAVSAPAILRKPSGMRRRSFRRYCSTRQCSVRIAKPDMLWSPQIVHSLTHMRAGTGLKEF